MSFVDKVLDEGRLFYYNENGQETAKYMGPVQLLPLATPFIPLPPNMLFKQFAS